MKLVPYDKKMLGGEWYMRSNNLKTLEEFADSNLECVKVEGFTQKDAFTCAASLRASINRYRMYGITAISRKGECFLVRKNISEE